MRPSASSASSTVAAPPRPCGADRKFSRRSSTHFTGRPSSQRRQRHERRLDRQRALGAERAADVGHAHADGRSGAPSICASCARGRCAPCEDDQTVSRSPSRAASAPRGLHRHGGQARDHGSLRTTCAARANAPATSPALRSQRTSTSPARGSTTASAARSRPPPARPGPRPARATPPPRPRRAGRRSGPRRRPAAGAARRRAPRPGGGRLRRRARPVGRGEHGIASFGARTPSTRARACGLRTNAMCAVPSSRMSSRNCERPRRMRSSSSRRSGRPTNRPA